MAQSTVARIMIFIASITLFVITYLGYERINNLILASNLVNHTNLVRLQLERTYRELREADSELNSFLLTGDTVFYHRLQTSEGTIKKNISQLYSLIKDNPEQCYRLYTMEKQIKERYAIMESNLKTDNRGVQRANISAIQQLSDNISLGFQKMIDDELVLLEEREIAKSQYESFTPMLIFILALFALAVMLFAYYRINAELALRTRMQKELEKKNTALSNTNKELEHFAFGSSHDLQEPLRKIETFCSLLEHKHLLNGHEEGTRLLNKIQLSARRMRTMVNDLLGYARFYYSDDQNTLVRLSEVVEDVLQDYQPLIEEKRAEVFVEPLPEVTGVQPQLYRLFQNLISNAIKYSGAENRPVINIKSARVASAEIREGMPTDIGQNEFYRISVEDNGIGFEEQFSDKIFMMFQRLHNKHIYEGTGIGLAICKKVVQNHGGFISAKSIKDKGSVFNVYLPVNPRNN